MATARQKEAARRNIARAREVQSERAHGEDVPREAEGMSTAEKDRLADAEFAFPGSARNRSVTPATCVTRSRGSTRSRA
jgi:hypothetical protein